MKRKKNVAIKVLKRKELVSTSSWPIVLIKSETRGEVENFDADARDMVVRFIFSPDGGAIKIKKDWAKYVKRLGQCCKTN